MDVPTSSDAQGLLTRVLRACGSEGREDLCRQALELVLDGVGAQGGAVLSADGPGAFEVAAARGAGESAGRLAEGRAEALARASAGIEIEGGLLLPLPGRGGRLAGALAVLREGSFSPAERELLETVSGAIGLGLERSRADLALEQLKGDLKKSTRRMEQQGQDLAMKNQILTESNRLLSSDHIRREQELKMAQGIQMAMLPRHPPEAPGIWLAARLQPMEGVAGDFYSYRLGTDGKLRLMIGDVSGHGVPAALIMTMTESLLGHFGETTDSLVAVLDQVNRTLVASFDEATTHFVTVFYAVLDTRDRRLRYAKAGHNPPLLLRRGGGEPEILDTDGLFLGCFAEGRFEERETRLQPGDKLVLYTDGVVEAENPREGQFGLARFVETLVAEPFLTPAGLIASVLARLEAFTAGQPVQDDVTLLALEVDGGVWERIEIPTSREREDELVEDLRRRATALGFPPAAVQDLALGYTEALANAIEHGNLADPAKRVTIERLLLPERVVLRVTDEGEGFDALALAREILPGNELQERGRGLILMHRLLDEVSWNRKGNQVTLVKYNPQARAARCP